MSAITALTIAAGIVVVVGRSVNPAPDRMLAAGAHDRALPVFEYSPPPPEQPTTTTTAPPAVTPNPGDPAQIDDGPVAASTTLATPNAPSGVATTYAFPGGPATGTVGKWYGYQLTVPVLATQGDWLEVRLPQRPNGSLAWVNSADVTLSSTPLHIIVHLEARRLELFDSGTTRVLSFPVGLGVPATPTPRGDFFVTVPHAPAPNAGYGPFVISTSGHSEAIQSWEGEGDAIIAIHGPISSYADAQIGSGGARVSNGCIRLHDADLAQLSGVPAGTPVDIEP